MAKWKNDIQAGELIVLFVDECHLMWGDICGYAWGPKNERISVSVKNEREKQTYYGAINALTGETTIKEYPKGTSEYTVDFVKYLQDHYKGKRITIIWDGASYHKYDKMREYLGEVNKDFTPNTYPLTCLLFAPNAPEQNPIEDIWLKGKLFIRQHARKCTVFKNVKDLFFEALNSKLFQFEKLHKYQTVSIN